MYGRDNASQSWESNGEGVQMYGRLEIDVLRVTVGKKRGVCRDYERWKLPVPSSIAVRSFCFITSLQE